MKRKCKFCGSEFEFKAKDLELVSVKAKVYKVQCPFCYTTKNLFYNHVPRHIKIRMD